MYLFLSKRHLYAAFLLIIFAVSTLFIMKSNQSVPSISWAIADETIIIDPGHGGIFPGKISASGIKEKDINLQVALKLQSCLLASGADIIMTRTADSALCAENTAEASLLLKQRADLKARTLIASQASADCFLSIHANSIPAEQWHGAQVFYRPDDEGSRRLAIAIQNRLCEQLGNTERQALAREDTFLFENLTIPAVIIECGFLSNPEEAELLSDDFYQQKIAHAIYLGVSDYFSEY